MNRALLAAFLLAAAGVAAVSLRAVSHDAVGSRTRSAVAAVEPDSLERADREPEPSFARRETAATETPKEEAESFSAPPVRSLRRDDLSIIGDIGSEPLALHGALVRLVETLRASPELVSTVATRLCEGETGCAEAGRLLSCLASSGSRECQNALLAVVKAQHVDLERRRQALRSLATVNTRIPHVDPMLAKLVDGRGPLASEALVTWSALTRRAHERGQGDVEAVMARVVEWLEESTSVDEARVALEAFGHLASSRVPLPILDATRSPEPDLRLAAIRSLRSVSSSKAEEALVLAARDDQSERVRLCALEILGAHPTAEGSRLQRVIQAAADCDPAESVRGRAAEILAAAED